MVNAEYLAKRRGIKVETVHRGNGDDYHNRIGIQAETAEGIFTVAGSVFQPDSPRLVQINVYQLDFIPPKLSIGGTPSPRSAGYHRPGTGTILEVKRLGLSIAATVGMGVREQGESKAVMVMSCDAPLPPHVLERPSNRSKASMGARQVVLD